jgi:hypothetical protein
MHRPRFEPVTRSDLAVLLYLRDMHYAVIQNVAWCHIQTARLPLPTTRRSS